MLCAKFDNRRAQSDIRISSHRLAQSDDFLAVSAGVHLVVASWDTEGDAAAAQPQADQAHDQEKNPSECALCLVDVSHAEVATELTLDRDWVVRPVAVWVSSNYLLLDDNLLLLGLITLRHTSWHGLLLHHLLLAHWLLLLHSVWHLLRSVLLGLCRWGVLRLLLLLHGLLLLWLLDHWLLFGVNWCTVNITHAVCGRVSLL